MASQDSKPLIALADSARMLHAFHSASARALCQRINMHTGHCGAIESWLARDLKASHFALGPPRGGGDEAFNRTASHRSQETGVRAQRHLAEIVQHSLNFRRSRLAYLRA
jgi:hypothetical protein